MKEQKPKILFIMHMPPPVHGAAMMGKYIHDSKVRKRLYRTETGFRTDQKCTAEYKEQYRQQVFNNR